MSRTTSNRYYLWKYMGSSEQKCLQNLSVASSFDKSFCYQCNGWYLSAACVTLQEFPYCINKMLVLLF